MNRKLSKICTWKVYSWVAFSTVGYQPLVIFSSLSLTLQNSNNGTNMWLGLHGCVGKRMWELKLWKYWKSDFSFSLGPFGERDDQQVFIQKVVPITNKLFVRLSSTGKRCVYVQGYKWEISSTSQVSESPIQWRCLQLHLANFSCAWQLWLCSVLCLWQSFVLNDLT